jgi:hypothetical protein
LIKEITALIQGGTANFTPLEKTLLSGLESRLGPTAGDLLRKQINEIDLIQRHSDCREVCCYTKRRDPSLTFPARAAEIKFATIEFRIPQQTTRWRADFHLVNGHFFSIDFTPTPKAIRMRTDFEIESAEILHDPMKTRPPVGSRQVELAELHLRGWLRGWSERYTLKELYEPLPANERHQRIAEIGVTLPPDYLELTTQCEGLTVNDCGIFGLSQVYEVVLPEWNYYLLAEIDGKGAVGVRAHSTDGILYFLDFGGDGPTRLEGSLHDVIERLINRKERA